MWNFKIAGVDLYHIAAWLCIYSILGWVWESSYVSVKQKKLVNRGFVTGPVCTIYGVGAVGVYLVLHPLSGNWLALYFGGVVVATALEYFTAMIMERLFHTSWWDYTNKKYNLHGRICLGSSVAWGFFTLIMFFVLHPFVEMVVGWIEVRTGKLLLVILTIIYAVDFGYAVATALQFRKKLAQLEQAVADFTEQLQERKIYTSLSEMMEKLEPLRKNFSMISLKERLEQSQDILMGHIESRGLIEQKDVVLQKFKVVGEKLSNAISRGNWNSRRLLRAYPNMGKQNKLHKKLFQQIRMEKLYKGIKENKKGRSKMVRLTFKGGIHPFDGKELSKDKLIRDVLPKGELVYPLSQHIGAPAVPVVKKGDHVLAGQVIAEAGGFVSAPVHASVSGTVKAIESRLTVTGNKTDAIVIENDGQYTEISWPVRAPFEQLSSTEILSFIRDAGIVGMGGAGFPTHVKLSPKEPDKIDYIIANCAECEPYLTSDYRRMMEEPEKIVAGLRAALKIFPHAKGIIAVEDNKKDAIALLKKAAVNDGDIEVMKLKTKYPQGAERQLIYATTGRMINSSMLPADAGCIVNNCDTIYAIYQAVYKGRPLMHRIVM